MKNKKWLIYGFFTILILGILIAIIVFFYNKSSSKTANSQDKIKDEFEYLNKTTLSMINSLSNLSSKNIVQIEKISTSVSSQNSEVSSDSSSSGGGQQGEQTSDSSSSQETSGSDTSNSQETSYTLKNKSIMLQDKSFSDWEKLEKQAEDLYSSWVTITLDLNSSNVSGDNILEYNSNLDNLLVSIKNQDIVNSKICLANLYSLIPIYMEQTSSNDDEIKIEKVKSSVVSAYSIVENGDWNKVSQLLGQAEVDLTNLINSSSSAKETIQAEKNKSYVLLKELIKSSNEQNLDLFYLKYINLIEELEKI
ncbi:MAG: hypothetical protein ACI4VQ_00650 [Clostridia bacterium]